MRKLASIRKIAAIEAIPEADKICTYVVDGWKVVDSIGKYNLGDLAVYLEVDSWVPSDIAPFLSKGKEPSVFEGVKGERLRTIKLKKQFSQGLLLSIPEDTSKGAGILIEEGLDLTDHLGILKYEKPIPAQLQGMAKGNFPSQVPKTDQERIQNLSKYWDELKQGTWTITEKLDGSSCTMLFDENKELNVCSRNLNLKDTENNSFWKAARKYATASWHGVENLAFQGELIGEGIQGNQYKVSLDWFVYDIYNTTLKTYIKQADVAAICRLFGLKHVPVIAENFTIPSSWSIDDLLLFAEGKSLLNGSEREGLVFQSNQDPNLSFKVVSNKWLYKTGE